MGQRKWGAAAFAASVPRDKWLTSLCLLLGLVCTAAYLLLNLRSIHMQMPYPRNFDEPIVTDLALKILTTGDFNTGYFRKPPFPVYLAAAGMAAGYLDAAKHQSGLLPKDIGAVGYPHYKNSRVMFPARALFALLGVLALLLLGLAGWRAFRAPPLVFLVPLIGALSPTYFFMCSGYINVDIAAVFFSALLLAWLAYAQPRPAIFYQAIAPGVLCGLATACKYNFALSLLAVLLLIGLHGRQQRLEKTAVAFICALLAFLIVTPYALLDFSTFLGDLGIEIGHYAGGHPGYDGDPGWPQFKHYTLLLTQQFGAVILVLSVLGLIFSSIMNWRASAVLYLFPLLFFGYMCGQRVNFERSILIVYAVLPVWAGMGLVALWHAAAWMCRRITGLQSRLRLRAACCTFAVLALALPLLPYRNLTHYVREQPDSRTLAVNYILKNVDHRIPVVVPEEMGMDLSPLLEAGYSVATPAFLKISWEDILALRQAPLMILPQWDFDSRYPGKELSVKLNQWTSRFKPIGEFGRNPVLVNYQYPVKSGNPRFYLAQDLANPGAE